MGDVWRGLKFYVFDLLAFLVGYVLSYTVGTSTSASLTYLAFVAIWIWNIVDAYNMTKEDNEIGMLSEGKMAAFEKRLQAQLEFVNSIQVNNNGVLLVQAMAF